VWVADFRDMGGKAQRREEWRTGGVRFEKRALRTRGLEGGESGRRSARGIGGLVSRGVFFRRLMSPTLVDAGDPTPSFLPLRDSRYNCVVVEYEATAVRLAC